jgi:hypothetical protein
MKGLAKIGGRPYYFGLFLEVGIDGRGSRGSYSLGLIKTRGWRTRSSGRTKRLPDHRVSGRDRRTRDLRVFVRCHFVSYKLSFPLTESTAQNRQVAVCGSATRGPVGRVGRSVSPQRADKKKRRGLLTRRGEFPLPLLPACLNALPCLPDCQMTLNWMNQGEAHTHTRNECCRDDVIICGLVSLGTSYLLQPSQFGLLV